MEKIISVYQIIMLILLFVTLSTRSILLYLTDKINPFVLGKDKKGFNAMIEYAFFIGLIIWAFELVSMTSNWDIHLLPESLLNNYVSLTWIKIIGMLFILIGYIIFILSLIAFGNSWRIGIDKSKPGQLITSGIFSLTRNPIFVYIDLYFIGTALINPNIFFILFALIEVTGTHYQILQEEKFLKSHYGNEYSEYMKRVRRYL